MGCWCKPHQDTSGQAGCGAKRIIDHGLHSRCLFFGAIYPGRAASLNAPGVAD
jgi:hypothetical protein